MSQEKQMPDFDIPGVADSEEPIKLGRIDRFQHWLIAWTEKKFGKDSRVPKFLKSLEPRKRDKTLDVLTQLKNEGSALERTNLLLMIILIIVLVFTWKKMPVVLAEVDQYRNDLNEQEQVIKMEQQNNDFLEKMAEDKNALTENIHKVYAAVPDSDEKAEEVMSMLEDIAAKNHIVIDAIGIRKVSESQVNYDDLIGVVDVYEYTFTLESNLPHILSFIGALRNSLRLMDIMTLEIEEGKTGYRATFTLHAYHLAEI
ncbi:MAG: hypothetical protein V1880_01755 [Patescibacteria group bacterium]